jgi:hypothetical protein
MNGNVSTHENSTAECVTWTHVSYEVLDTGNDAFLKPSDGLGSKHTVFVRISGEPLPVATCLRCLVSGCYHESDCDTSHTTGGDPSNRSHDRPEGYVHALLLELAAHELASLICQSRIPGSSN